MRWTVRRRIGHWRSGLAALLICLGGPIGCGDGGGSADVLRIGVVAPLEQYVGARVRRGAEFARDRLNEDGGVRGRPVELVFASDSANPERAVAVADELFADRSVVAVIGHANSGATLAAATIYNRGLSAVSPSATSPDIASAGEWIFRIASGDDVNAARLAEFALRELGTRAAIFYANEPYGRGLREGFRRAFLAGGGTLVEEYPYLEGRTTDFEPYLLGTAQSSPDLIFIAGLDESAGDIIRQARRIGMRVPFVGGDGLVGLAGRDANYHGTYVGLLYHPDMPGMQKRDFVSAYAARFGEPPDHFAALAYDAVLLVARAAEEAGISREAIRRYLEAVGREEDRFEGVTGTLAFDANGDPIDRLYAIGRLSGDGIELISVEGDS